MIFENNSVIVGLTGMSGAGKTSACRVFRECGFMVVDCDIAARTVVQPGKPALAEIAGRFGKKYLCADGSLDRKKLGNLVFSSETERLALNEIIYPYISYEIIAGVISYIDKGTRCILLDAPTLFESGADALCNLIVSVVSDRGNCAERIMKRDGLTAAQAEQRLSSQHSADFYRRRSDFCVENNGTAEELRENISEIAAAIMKGTVTAAEKKN